MSVMRSGTKRSRNQSSVSFQSSLHVTDDDDEVDLDENDEEENENNQDDQDEEEEIIVFAQFPEFDGLDFVHKAQSIQLDLDSLFSENPKCKVRGCEFIGQFEETLGTKLFFMPKTVPLDISSGKDIQERGIAGLTNTAITFQMNHIDIPIENKKSLSIQPLKRNLSMIS